jgi:tetratricopeptide (TPR) repeat protein
VGTLLEEAENYHDLNPLEREFVAACQEEANRQEAAHRRELKVANQRTVAMAGMCLLAVAATVFAGIKWRNEKTARQAAEEADIEAERLKGIEEARKDALALAISGIQYEHQGKYKLAISFYIRAIDREKTFAFPHLLLGTVYVAQLQFPQSIAEYNKAIELEPVNAGAHFLRGVAYHLQGNYKDAIDEYTRAIELDEEFADAHRWLGMVYATLDKHDDATREYKLALKHDPESADNHNSLGYNYLHQKKLKEAVEELEIAVSRSSPQDYNPFFNLGLAYALQGHADKARQQWKKGLSRCQGELPIDKLNRALYMFVIGESGAEEVRKFLAEAKLPKGLLREALRDAELLAQCPASTKPKDIKEVIKIFEKAMAEDKEN